MPERDRGLLAAVGTLSDYQVEDFVRTLVSAPLWKCMTTTSPTSAMHM